MASKKAKNTRSTEETDHSTIGRHTVIDQIRYTLLNNAQHPELYEPSDGVRNDECESSH